MKNSTAATAATKCRNLRCQSPATHEIEVCVSERRVEGETYETRESWPVCFEHRTMAGSRIRGLRRREGAAPEPRGPFTAELVYADMGITHAINPYTRRPFCGGLKSAELIIAGETTRIDRIECRSCRSKARLAWLRPAA
jgi:hypothetical protein